MPRDTIGVTTIPRDSNGNYTLPNGSTAVTGQVILASTHNLPIEDLASSMTNSLARSGVGGMQNNLQMNNNKIIGMADGAAASDAATVGQLPQPAVSIDNRVTRFDGIAGKLQISTATLNDDGSLDLTATTAGKLLSLTSTDPGAAGGPDIDAYRDSASPAVSDILARLLFNGRDSAGNKQLYAIIQAIITDPTTATEDAVLDFQTVVNAVVASRMQLGAGLFASSLTDPGAGKANFTEVQASGKPLGLFATATVTLSGAAVDFTGIPSWVKRITLQLNGVSTTGTSNARIQLGTSSGVETSGYNSVYTIVLNAAATGALMATSGFEFAAAAASNIHSGTIVFTLANAATNSWIASGNLARTNTGAGLTSVGDKALSATLDRIRLTTANGTDTYDAGSACLIYEG